MINAQMYPPFSRNFNDEDDYESARAAVLQRSFANLRKDPILSWTNSFSCDCSTLIIAVNPAVQFITKCFDTSNQQDIGELVVPIFSTSSNIVDFSSVPQCNELRCPIKLLGSGILLVIFPKEIPDLLPTLWVNKLISGVNPKSVVVYDALIGLAGAEMLKSHPTGAVRSLKINFEVKNLKVHMTNILDIETPSLLTGCTAAIVCYCHRRAIPLLALVAVLRINEGRTVANVLEETIPLLQDILAHKVAINDSARGPMGMTLEDEFLRRTENMYM